MVKREAAIPDSDGGSGRWSVDLFLLDQDGRPTFVEVKRSTDSRIRREVVGQMLDYAANAQAFWPLGQIKAYTEQSAGGPEQVLQRLTEFLDHDDEKEVENKIQRFWENVDRNLKEGSLRLIFVADTPQFEFSDVAGREALVRVTRNRQIG